MAAHDPWLVASATRASDNDVAPKPGMPRFDCTDTEVPRRKPAQGTIAANAGESDKS